MYHNDKASAISDEDKGQMEKLDPENASVKVLLDIVQGKPMEVIESWGQLVPITAVDKVVFLRIYCLLLVLFLSQISF
jgi:hypothetical protein